LLTRLEDLLEQLLEYSFSKQLPATAQRRVPGQRLTEVIAQKQAHIYTHAGSSDKAAVTDDILQIADEHQLDEYNRINALLPFGAIIGLRGFVQPLQIEQVIKSAIEIVFRYLLT